jgi:hypothetical protein
MWHKFTVACVLGLSLVGSVTAASAFAPGPVAGAAHVASDVVEASFFGRPYPYGYTGWARCSRYVEVQTHSGAYLRRTRVCK